MCVCVVILCLIPSKKVFINPRWANPKTAFGFAFLLFHVIRPLYLMLTGDYYGTRLRFYAFNSSREMNLMLLASVLGGTGFLLGWQWGIRRRGRQGTRQANKEHERDKYLLLKRVLILLPIAIIAFWWGWQGRVLPEQINLYYLLRSSLVAIAILLGIAAVGAKTRAQRIDYLILAAILTSVFVWLFLKEGGASRLFLLLFLLPGFVILSFLFKKRAFVLIVALTVISVALFMVLGTGRDYEGQRVPFGERLSFQVAGGGNDVVSYFLKGGDFEAFEKGMLIMQLIPEYEPPYLGRSFATLLVMPIPRLLWPGKPQVSLTDPIMNWNRGVPENFAITLIGEAYANWLWPGVFLVLSLFGFVSALIYKHALSPQSTIEQRVLIGLFMAYIILVVRGSFHTMTSYYFFCLIWFIASAWIVRLSRNKIPITSNAMRTWHRRQSR
jgi:oligosaccharide repeat unit polymerase